MARNPDFQFDDETPSRRRTGRRGHSGNGLLQLALLALGLGAVAVAVAVAGLVAVMLVTNAAGVRNPPGGVTDTPESAFEDYRQGILTRDYGRAYDRLDSLSKQRVDLEYQALTRGSSNPELQAHAGKRGRSLYVAVLQTSDEIGKPVAPLETKDDDIVPKADEKQGKSLRALQLKDAKIVSVEKNHVLGTLLMFKDSWGVNQTVEMVYEDGGWRVNITSMTGNLGW